MPIDCRVFLLPLCNQIAKLLIIPFVCLVELFWMGRRFTTPVVCSILLVILGVAVV
jgi:solute carrier family 35 protein E3